MVKGSKVRRVLGGGLFCLGKGCNACLLAAAMDGQSVGEVDGDCTPEP